MRLLHLFVSGSRLCQFQRDGADLSGPAIKMMFRWGGERGRCRGTNRDAEDADNYGPAVLILNQPGASGSDRAEAVARASRTATPSAASTTAS